MLKSEPIGRRSVGMFVLSTSRVVMASKFTWQNMTYLGKSSQNYSGGRGALRHFFFHHWVYQCWKRFCVSDNFSDCDQILVFCVKNFWLWPFVSDLKYHLLKSLVLPHYLYMNHTCWTYNKICENTVHGIFWQYIFLWIFYHTFIIRCFNFKTSSTKLVFF